MASFLDILTWGCTVVYGGTLITFAALFSLYPTLSGRPPRELVRVFSAAGPVLGLAMGGLFFGVFASRYHATGNLSWGLASVADGLELATLLSFGALWFSSFVLEIWTFDSIRPAREDNDDYPVNFPEGYRRTARHLLINALLFLAWLCLRVATGAA